MSRDETPKFARLAVRTDGTAVVGMNSGLLKPGHVYEVREIVGVLHIKDQGESCVTVAERRRHPQYMTEGLREGDTRADAAHPNHTWARDISHIMQDGMHLYTGDELVEARKKWRKE